MVVTVMVDHRKSLVILGFLFLLIGPTLEQLTEPLSSVTERGALLELRSSLGLRSRDWPRKADPCLVWNGVHCNGGRVVGINISGFRRTRIGRQNPQFSVDALANLTMLSSFNSSKFTLPGSIPDWLGPKLSSLQVLDLRSCSIIGTIPRSLGNFTSLTNLYLTDNSLTGLIPLSLGQLSGLSVLDLSQNSLTGSIPSSFSSLGNLSFLDISSNFLSGSIPQEIGNLSKLQVLNLSNNSLSSSIPAELSDLASLVEFDLSINFLSGSLSEKLFSSQNQLQIINLSHNGFTGALPNIFLAMSALRLFDVSHNNFTGILTNNSLSFNATNALFNLSQNMLYGNLTALPRGLKFIDLLGNYFEGKVPDYAQNNTSLNLNCLQNVSNQRTISDCQSFYAENGLIFDDFGLPNSTQPLPVPKSWRKRHKNLIILFAVLGGLALIVFIVFVCVLLFICARKRSDTAQRENGEGPVPTTSTPPPPGVAIRFSTVGEKFTHQQILQATSEFSDGNLIKHGHSGDIFRGFLEGGIPVVIKRINLPSVKKDGHLMELDLFSKVSHIRLVPFLGHCFENENEKFLVYKYMPNEDLSSALFRKTNPDDDSLQSLDWITRLKIAIGTAEGLTYLHHECTPPLVHRDVQASSILLDDKFEVRLGSLTEVCAQEGDTHHQRRITKILRLPQTSYQGPSGSSTATCAYDVYCFGKVLLELITGKLGISASNDTTKKEWLDETLPYISIYDKELVTKIIDPTLIIYDDLLEEVWAIAIVAKSCLNPKPSRRPLMRYILKALENPFRVVREESSSSEKLRATESSRRSWNAAIFGSWRHGGSDVANIPSSSVNKVEAGGSLKNSGTTGSQSQGSGQIGNSSSSRRRHLKEIYPEPLDHPQDV